METIGVRLSAWGNAADMAGYIQSECQTEKIELSTTGVDDIRADVAAIPFHATNHLVEVG